MVLYGHRKNILGIVVVILTIVAFKIVIWQVETQGTQVKIEDYKNTSYVIEGQSVTLVDGISETASAPGSASKVITSYFGNIVRHDLNNDGQEDVVFLLTQNRGGSGSFFYVVAALHASSGYIGSQAFFLGDRIAPQSIYIDEGITTQGTHRQNVIVVNFVTHKPNEPLVNYPTVGKSVWIKLDPTTMQFGEVAQNFEGESM